MTAEELLDAKLERALGLFDQRHQQARERLVEEYHHLAIVDQAMRALGGAGMYPAVPREQWQDRDNTGKRRYLYMTFTQNSRGGFRGPGGKRKVYVGCNPQEIDGARAKAHRRKLWESLQPSKERIERCIAEIENSMCETLKLAQQRTSLPAALLAEVRAAIGNEP